MSCLCDFWKNCSGISCLGDDVEGELEKILRDQLGEITQSVRKYASKTSTFTQW